MVNELQLSHLHDFTSTDLEDKANLADIYFLKSLIPLELFGFEFFIQFFLFFFP